MIKKKIKVIFLKIKDELTVSLVFKELCLETDSNLARSVRSVICKRFMTAVRAANVLHSRCFTVCTEPAT